ncbi:unnamed protein product [Strongylus vulgaris]|uniref:Uncharacterized protein n=1 Tax=Strongylus vulgaris TaxID=40348 RepID=A0A3P7L2R1_STRVU|nr:unnamed protein product [Strongylus vulgaris]
MFVRNLLQCNYVGLVKCFINILDEWAWTLYELKDNVVTITSEQCVHLKELDKITPTIWLVRQASAAARLPPDGFCIQMVISTEESFARSIKGTDEPLEDHNSHDAAQDSKVRGRG